MANKSKPLFRTSVTFNPLAEENFEVLDSETLTVQDDAYTVRELFQRHLAGQLPDVQRETYYQDTVNFDSIDFHNLKYADPFEKERLLVDVKEKAQRAMDSLKKWREQQELDDLNTDSQTASKSSKSKNKSDVKGESGEPASERSGASDANSDSPKNTK